MGRLSKEQIEFIKENVDKLTNREMANILGCNVSTISNWRKKLNISFSDLHDFSSKNEYIVSNYNNRTAKSLAEEIGCSKEYVTKVWSENNCHGKDNRSYYADFDYFQNIDTPNKAYIIGLIAADGCVYKRDNHQGMWNISIHKDDIDILEQIKKEISSEAPIKINKQMATLTTTSQKMYDDLCKIGFVPNKTYEMCIEDIFNNIQTKFCFDFIHGYFDGDGSISIGKIPSRSKMRFAIPERFSDSFVSHLLDFEIESNYYSDERTEKYLAPFGSLEITGASNKYCLAKLFSLHNTISIKRKTELCHQLCEQIQSNSTNRNENKTAVIKWEELLENLRR